MARAGGQPKSPSRHQKSKVVSSCEGWNCLYLFNKNGVKSHKYLPHMSLKSTVTDNLLFDSTRPPPFNISGSLLNNTLLNSPVLITQLLIFRRPCPSSIFTHWVRPSFVVPHHLWPHLTPLLRHVCPVKDDSKGKKPTLLLTSHRSGRKKVLFDL